MKKIFLSIEKLLINKFSDSVSQFIDNRTILEFYTDAKKNMEVLNYLYDAPELAFRFLTDLTAIHYPENKGAELEVVYHLHNMINNERIRIKCKLPIDKPEIETATELFSGANWMERETFDFFGVIFINHPNLKRILNVNELDYYPLRKEYPLEEQTRQDKDDEMFGR